MPAMPGLRAPAQNSAQTSARGLGAPLQDPRELLQGLFADIREPLHEVERRLEGELSSKHPAIDRVLRHGFRLGGKRLRPALVLLTGQALGGINDGHIALATVMEMIHTATLVHDDVLDEADLRRHVDTVNARWGNETSILLGDFLFSSAFTLSSTLGDASLCRTIGMATKIVCEGELRQTLSGGDLTTSEQDYLAMIDAKTAALCACCCEVSARWSGAKSDIIERFTRYGRSLGIAFQMVDDLIDLVASKETAGKTVGADIAKRKLTLPLIHARETLVNGPRAALMELVRSADPASREQIVRVLDSTGSLRYTQTQAQAQARVAIEQLEPFAGGSAAEALRALARFAAQRAA